MFITSGCSFVLWVVGVNLVPSFVFNNVAKIMPEFDRKRPWVVHGLDLIEGVPLKSANLGPQSGSILHSEKLVSKWSRFWGYQMGLSKMFVDGRVTVIVQSICSL